MYITKSTISRVIENKSDSQLGVDGIHLPIHSHPSQPSQGKKPFATDEGCCYLFQFDTKMQQRRKPNQQQMMLFIMWIYIVVQSSNSEILTLVNGQKAVVPVREGRRVSDQQRSMQTSQNPSQSPTTTSTLNKLPTIQPSFYPTTSHNPSTSQHPTDIQGSIYMERNHYFSEVDMDVSFCFVNRIPEANDWFGLFAKDSEMNNLLNANETLSWSYGCGSQSCNCFQYKDCMALSLVNVECGLEYEVYLARNTKNDVGMECSYRRAEARNNLYLFSGKILLNDVTNHEVVNSIAKGASFMYECAIPSASPSVIIGWDIHRLDEATPLFGNNNGRDMKLKYAISTGREVQVKVYEQDCLTEVTDGSFTVEMSARTVIDEYFESFYTYLVSNTELLTSSQLWTSNSSLYGEIEICVRADILHNDVDTNITDIVTSENTYLGLYVDLTIQEGDATIMIDYEQYNGTVISSYVAPQDYALRVCQCNPQNDCISQPVSPANNILHVCLWINTTEYEFAGIRSYTITQGEDVTLTSIVNGEPNILTEVTVDGQFAKVSTLMVSAIFDAPIPIDLKGLASFATNGMSNSTARSLLGFQYRENFNLEIPVITLQPRVNESQSLNESVPAIIYSAGGIIIFLLVVFSFVYSRRKLHEERETLSLV